MFTFGSFIRSATASAFKTRPKLSQGKNNSHLLLFNRTFAMTTNARSQPNSGRPVGKKYVIACDGTWQNSDMGYDKTALAPPTAQIPTNVTRIVRALNHKDKAGTPQIVFYQRGVGTDSDLEDKLLGGLTGSDISEHIREAYAMLANNFNPATQAEVDDHTVARDEIVLLGFSRGAFTARAIASLISDIGLLTKIGMESFWGIFGDWMKQDIEGQESAWFQLKYGKKVAFTDPLYRETLIKDGLTRWGMPILAVGVWDTVGALGVPLPFGGKNVKEYSFVNTKVAQHVQHAFHAMALDEHRGLFTPTLWEQPEEPHKLDLLKQCWFPGVHSNIGGSYPDAGIANITLAWMVSQLEETHGGILSFDPNYLDWVQDQNLKYYSTVPEPIRPWGLGRLYDSTEPTSIMGRVQAVSPIVRTPGRYKRISNVDGKPTTQALINTNESIHPCVRIRMDAGGLGTEAAADISVVARLLNAARSAVNLHPDVHNDAPAKYKSPALANYELEQSDEVKTESENQHARNGSSGVYWKALDGGDGLPEEELGETEIRLLKRSLEKRGAAGKL